MLRKLATRVAASRLLRKGRLLHEQSPDDWTLGGSALNKLLANIYLILKDYGDGLFPPVMASRHEVLDSEARRYENYDNPTIQDMVDSEMVKPFNFPPHLLNGYLKSLMLVIETLEGNGIKPGSRLLELGCGMGWLAELLAWRGFNVTATTIAPVDVVNAKRRIDLVKARGVKAELEFKCTPMETVAQNVAAESFDAVFCFEALHHAYDWRESLASAAKCVKPGGYIMLMSEPPPLHTFVCYRSSRILKTYEIGLNRNALIDELRNLGFHNIQVRRPMQISSIKDIWRLFVPFTIENGSVMCRSYWITGIKK